MNAIEDEKKEKLHFNILFIFHITNDISLYFPRRTRYSFHLSPPPLPHRSSSCFFGGQQNLFRI